MDKSLEGSYTAILLAAGYGSRISELTNRPKCLLEINGKTLLERNFEIWGNLGIKNINIVLGYESEQIKKVAQEYQSAFTINYSYNENFKEQGNTFSFLLGVKGVSGPSLIFDADLIYDESILKQFIVNKEKSEILVGEGDINDIESAKTLIDDHHNVRKTVDKRAITPEELSEYQFIGEAIGVLKFNKEITSLLESSLTEFLSHKENLNLNWEHFLNLFLLKHEVSAHKFTSGRWLEIDTPEDYENAKNLFKES